MSNLNSMRAALARFIAPAQAPRKKLFIVLKFGGKRFLALTEDQLRWEIAKEATHGKVGVRWQEKALVFEAYECDPAEVERRGGKE